LKRKRIKVAKWGTPKKKFDKEKIIKHQRQEIDDYLHNKRQCPSRKTINNFFLGGNFLEINF
jgi:hypothetical protein